MILSLGGVELPPTAVFVAFPFFSGELHTRSDDSVYPWSRDSDRHRWFGDRSLFPDAETVGSQGSDDILI